MKNVSRRNFTKTLAMAGAGSIILPGIKLKAAEANSGSYAKGNLKLGLNAYSFDKPLRAGTMTLFDLLDYCGSQGIDGVDLTGYYFPGYPAVPSDDLIYNVKRHAYRLGIDICGTGVRNDFTLPDPEKRKAEKQLVKDWVIVAEKLGAPQVRIFSGNQPAGNYKWDEKVKWVADDVNECAEFGKKHGVMMALQNHNDFLKTAEDVDKIMKLVSSEWTGLMLDIGSYHTPDPYKDIAQNIKFATSWQFKEKVFINDNQVDTDYDKLFEIILKSTYSGYLPIETLGEGDPVIKVGELLKKIRAVMCKNHIL
jgi:sugar phosphate isomerase/epimerase